MSRTNSFIWVGLQGVSRCGHDFVAKGSCLPTANLHLPERHVHVQASRDWRAFMSNEAFKRLVVRAFEDPESMAPTTGNSHQGRARPQLQARDSRRIATLLELRGKGRALYGRHADCRRKDGSKGAGFEKPECCHASFFMR